MTRVEEAVTRGNRIRHGFWFSTYMKCYSGMSHVFSDALYDRLKSLRPHFL